MIAYSKLNIIELPKILFEADHYVKNIIDLKSIVVRHLPTYMHQMDVISAKIIGG